MKFSLSARQKDERRQGVRDRDVGCSAEQLERLLQWPNDGSRGRLRASRVLDHPGHIHITLPPYTRRADRTLAFFIMLLYRYH